MTVQTVNDHLVLLAGKAAVGKSGSLMELQNPERVVYLNCENGKKLPFPAKFKQVVVTDPLQVPATIEALNENPDYDTIVIDSNSFLMQMYENQYVITSSNTMKALILSAACLKGRLKTSIEFRETLTIKLKTILSEA